MGGEEKLASWRHLLRFETKKYKRNMQKDYHQKGIELTPTNIKIKILQIVILVGAYALEEETGVNLLAQW